MAVTGTSTALVCLKCGRTYPFDQTAYLCPACGPAAAEEDPGILDVLYDYRAAAAGFPSRSSLRIAGDVFRYSALLPVEPGSAPLLPAGGTPLVSAPRLARRVGLAALYIKDETRNPTRCLKDRATAIGVTLAIAQRHDTVYCASAGNAAISLAGFSAQAGLACEVYVPARASATRLTWLRRYGARVHISTGDYDQAFEESERDGTREGWYSRNCAFNPFLVEGKKTVAFEIAEQLGWRTPDIVVVPVGDGCTLGAIGKGFRELLEVGRAGTVPRLIGVQAEALQPLVRRFLGQPALEPGVSQAASIAVRHPRNALRLLNELRTSQGAMLAVPDDDIAAAARHMAAEAGVVAEFTSAATLAGLTRLAAGESLAGRTAVLVVTGGRTDGE